MELKKPVIVYTAATNVEAHVIVGGVAYKAQEDDVDLWEDFENSKPKEEKKRKKKKKPAPSAYGAEYGDAGGGYGEETEPSFPREGLEGQPSLRGGQVQRRDRRARTAQAFGAAAPLGREDPEGAERPARATTGSR